MNKIYDCGAQMQDQWDDLIQALRKTKLSNLPDIAAMLAHCFQSGGRLYLAGNGGSASDADHVAAEFVGRYRGVQMTLPAISLTNPAILTGLTNDYPHELLFANYLRAMAKNGDCLWVFSTSGRSENVLHAVRDGLMCCGCKIIAFLGLNDHEIVNLWPPQSHPVQYFWVESDDTARIQEVHRFAYHVVVDLVKQMMGK